MTDEKENPKLTGSGLVDCVVQTGPCQINCSECYYNGPSWYRTRDEPLLPPVEDTGDKVVRMKSGHDSNIDRDRVIAAATKYRDFFFNTSIPRFDFPGPVVFTCNGRPVTGDDVPDSKAFLVPADAPGVENLMFVRFRLSTWNVPLANEVVKHYTGLGVPVVMTWMRYRDVNNIPDDRRKNYVLKKHIVGEYYCVVPGMRNDIMSAWKDNRKVRQCGSAFKHFCKDCGNCRWYYGLWKVDHYINKKRNIDREIGWGG